MEKWFFPDNSSLSGSIPVYNSIKITCCVYIMKMEEKKMKKFLALLLALTMLVSMAACSKNPGTDPSTSAPSGTEGEGSVVKEGDYTYRSATTALATNLNSHTWENNADQAIMVYTETPLATMSISDSLNGVYQWVFLAAESVTDVTADHKDDLTKYAVTLPAGQTAEQTEKGFVFEIKLNPDMKWQDGTPINADTYIYSMKALLDPDMRNYRANLYYAGESAVAGGNAYYNSGAPIYTPMVPAYGQGETPDYSYDLDAGIQSGSVYISMTATDMTLYNESLGSLNSNYKLGFDNEVKALTEQANPYGYTKVTAENLETVKTLVYGILSKAFAITDEATQADLLKETLYVNNGETAEEVDYDSTVGCYKVDDYTIRYVTQTQIDYNYFLTSCTSNWLVYEDLYEAGKDTTGALVTTDYGTSVDKYMSYGPYKLESWQDGKQMVLTKNENYYEYQKTDSGYLYAFTDYEVDGESVQKYQTTKIVIDVMDTDAAKQAFLKGELSSWSPTADDLPNYSTSEQLYKADETYTMSLFFNCGLENLKTMDSSKGNTNSVVLSNTNFRKAMSLAIDRNNYVAATAGYTPTYSLLNKLYYYDVYNDPTSSYRNSEPAMQAICNLYGVEYGEGTPYATLEDAYKSINGYNLTEAQNLMKQACQELVEAGLYKEGEPVKIRIAWGAGALTSSDNQQLALLNKYINEAVAGSGFGTVTFEAVGNLTNRYGDVANGEYAIGYGAWGGAAFYPFRNLQVYCDPEQYDINEAGCWDPTTQTLTLTVNGEEMTKTWQDWSNCMVGSGDLANESFETKLQVLANLEEEFLKLYYRIPLASTTACEMQSYQCSYYTADYNIMYGYGGLELMTYNYTDAEWADYVSSQGGTLNYV